MAKKGFPRVVEYDTRDKERRVPGERREERRTERSEDLDQYLASLPPELRENYEALRQKQTQNIIRAYTEGWDRKRGLTPGTPGSMTSRQFGESRAQLAGRDEFQLAYTKLAVALSKYESDLLGKRATAEASRKRTKSLYDELVVKMYDSFASAESASDQARIGAVQSNLEGRQKELDTVLKKQLGDVQLPGEALDKIGRASETWRRAVNAQTASGKSAAEAPVEAPWNDYSQSINEALQGLNQPQRETAMLLIGQSVNQSPRDLWGAAIGKRQSSTQQTLAEMHRQNEAKKTTRGAQIEGLLADVSELETQVRTTGHPANPAAIVGKILPALEKLGLGPQGQILVELGPAIERGDPIDASAIEPHMEILLSVASGIDPEVAKELQSRHTADEDAPRTAESTIWDQFDKYESDPLDPGLSHMWRELEQTEGFKDWVKAREYDEGASLDFIRRAFIREMKAIKRSANMRARAKEAATILSGGRPASPGEKVRAAIRSQLNPYYTKGRGATDAVDSAALMGGAVDSGESPSEVIEDQTDPVETLREEQPALTAQADQEEAASSQTLTDDKGNTFTKSEDDSITTEDGTRIEPDSEAGGALRASDDWEKAGEGEGATLEDQAASPLDEPESEQVAEAVDSGEIGQKPEGAKTALQKALDAASEDAAAADSDEEGAMEEAEQDSVWDKIDADLGDAKRRSQERRAAGDPAGDVEDPMRQYLPGHMPDVDMEGSDVLQSGPPEEGTPSSGMGAPGVEMDMEDMPLTQQSESAEGEDAGGVFARLVDSNLDALEAKKQEIDRMLAEAKKQAGEGGVGEGLAHPNISGATATPAGGDYFGKEGHLRKKRAPSDASM